jgi:hypothetical protein
MKIQRCKRYGDLTPQSEDFASRGKGDATPWSEDRRRSFCVYDGPSPEAIRKSAARSGLPVDRITQVRVLDPYPYPELSKEQA